MADEIVQALLFLYEGETEKEFYTRLFHDRAVLAGRNIKVNKSCLTGNFNINSKVANAAYDYLEYLEKRSNKQEIKLNIVIALDREGGKPTPPPIDLSKIREGLNDKRVDQIDLIVATQDLESWLFIDIENIYRFLRVSQSKRNLAKYKYHENFNNKANSTSYSMYHQFYLNKETFTFNLKICSK